MAAVRYLIIALALVVTTYPFVAVATSSHPNVIRPAPLTKAVPKATGTQDFCQVCIDFALYGINELLNIIANAGILGGCSDLCGKLPKKLEQDICDAACVGVGLDEFIRILEKDDIDPVGMRNFILCLFLLDLHVRACPYVRDCGLPRRMLGN